MSSEGATVSPAWSLTIKHGQEEILVSLADPNSKVQDVHKVLEHRTGVLAKRLKIIYKGKVLDASALLSQCKVPASRAKLMMLVAQGEGSVQTKGQAVMDAAKKQKQEAAAAHIQAAFAAVRSGASPHPFATTSSTAAGSVNGAGACQRADQRVDRWWVERSATWVKTGVVSLRDLGLEGGLPEGVFTVVGQGEGAASAVGQAKLGVGQTAAASAASAAEPTTTAGGQGGGSNSGEAASSCGPSSSRSSPLAAARLADLSHNALSSLPHSVSVLQGLVTLKLDHNRLTDAGLPWDALAALAGLTHLALDHNLLTQIPSSALLGLPRLRALTAASNQLESLPESVGSLASLELLNVDCNRLQQLPEPLGDCSSLADLSACSNRIARIPDAFRRLGRLQVLRLAGNRVEAVPSSVLIECTSLTSLQLESNPITLDALRATEGFKAYDTRRVARCDKQLEGGALFDVNRSFSEGADQQLYQHWHQNKKS